MTTHSAKGYKYLITANIEKVKLNIAFPVEMLILWKRGNQKIETKNKIIHCPKTGNESLINEELSMFACFQYSENNTVFIEKNTTFSLIILTPKAKKIAGTCTLNLSDYINRKLTDIREEFLLEKCPDKTAKLSLRMKFEFISEVNEKEMLNQSGISSKLSEPTSLVDESFRNFCNDITFSLGSTSHFRNEKPLKEQPPGVYNRAIITKENNNEIASSLINSIENFKSLNSTTSEILFLKRKISEKNDEISKNMKNFEEFKRISHENEDKITSLEFINKNLKEALEKAQEEEKKFEARNSEILFQNQLLEEENKETQKNNEILQESLKDSEKTVATFETKFVNIQQEKTILTKQIEVLMSEKMEMLKFKEKIEKYEHSIHDFSSNLEKAQSEIISMKQNQLESDKTADSLKEELENYKKLNEELKSSKEKSIFAMEEEIKQYNDEKNQIQKNLREAESLISKYEAGLEQNRVKLEKNQLDNKEKILLEKELERSLFEINELRINNSTLKEEMDVLQEKSQKIQNKLDFTLDLLKKYEVELEKTRKEGDLKQEKVVFLQNELDIQKADNMDLKSLINDKDKKTQESLDNHKNKLEITSNALKIELEKQKNENNNLKILLSSTKEEINSLKNHVEAKNRDEVSFKEEIIKQKSDISRLYQLNNTSNEEISDLKVKLKESKAQIIVNEESLNSAQNKLINKENDLKLLKTELEAYKSENEAFKKGSKKESLEKEIGILRNEMKTNNIRLIATDDLLRKYEEELELTKKKLEKKKLKIDNLNKSRMVDSGIWNEEEKTYIQELEETNIRLKGEIEKLKEKIKGFQKENEGNLVQIDNESQNIKIKSIKDLEIRKKDEIGGLEEKIERIENYYLLTQLEINKYETQNGNLRVKVESNQQEIKELKQTLLKSKLI